MLTTLTTAMLAVAISNAPIQEPPKQSEWIDLGEYRITTYCEYCNEPSGHKTASGEYLEYGQVAMNDVPFGTKIAIEGAEFVVTDRCGIDNTVDIFMPAQEDKCTCHHLDYQNVRMKKE